MRNCDDGTDDSNSVRLMRATQAARCNWLPDGFETVKRLANNINDINYFNLLDDVSRQAFLNTAKTFIATKFQYNPDITDQDILTEMMKQAKTLLPNSPTMSDVQIKPRADKKAVKDQRQKTLLKLNAIGMCWKACCNCMKPSTSLK